GDPERQSGWLDELGPAVLRQFRVVDSKIDGHGCILDPDPLFGCGRIRLQVSTTPHDLVAGLARPARTRSCNRRLDRTTLLSRGKDRRTYGTEAPSRPDLARVDIRIAR